MYSLIPDSTIELEHSTYINSLEKAEDLLFPRGCIRSVLTFDLQCKVGIVIPLIADWIHTTFSALASATKYVTHVANLTP